MTENGINPMVDFYFDKAEKWQEEPEQLKTIVFDYGLLITKLQASHIRGKCYTKLY